MESWVLENCDLLGLQVWCLYFQRHSCLMTKDTELLACRTGALPFSWPQFPLSQTDERLFLRYVLMEVVAGSWQEEDYIEGSVVINVWTGSHLFWERKELTTTLPSSWWWVVIFLRMLDLSTLYSRWRTWTPFASFLPPRVVAGSALTVPSPPTSPLPPVPPPPPDILPNSVVSGIWYIH